MSTRYKIDKDMLGVLERHKQVVLNSPVPLVMNM